MMLLMSRKYCMGVVCGCVEQRVLLSGLPVESLNQLLWKPGEKRDCHLPSWKEGRIIGCWRLAHAWRGVPRVRLPVVRCVLVSEDFRKK
jgi:hypothetical protein